eukprot:CAMPEP_0206141382 /NCGR_PEP_ID=MMETSP1473-20131121/12728_1 /ASSEMBLY_ACC=CAM_ASM_001109 /TAXON_ID=1461547 /ORGANISM="Stichococcus sp, Strain RCC1054" /LENGTH=280 /DNA_ID=CAMNT_0053535931 /DNA_START=152 /DNA_END=994 /DNA_ORIENTATION=-
MSVPVLGGRWRDVPHAAAPSHARAVTLQTRISSEARLRSSAIASTSYTATCGPGHAQRGDALIAAAKVHSSQVFSGVSGTRRRIIMMRHAESEDATENVRDHDRAITEMGRSAAQQVAKQMYDAGWEPDLIMCSDSVRTRETLEAMQAAYPALLEASAVFRGDLYTIAATDGQTRSHLSRLIVEETARMSACTVLCLGHNRGWEECASSFAGQKVKLRPCTAALLQEDAPSWSDAFSAPRSWKLIATLGPDLEAQDEEALSDRLRAKPDTAVVNNNVAAA